jgi:myo-inositol 2-dehydrogenase/D-chiro-inositol 1-dehydrogenase
MSETLSLADRRAFLKAGTIAAAASSLPSVLNAQVGGSDEIKIALVGCGGRGSGAAAQSLAVPGTRLVAMADAFGDNLEGAYNQLKGQFGERIDVPQERRFSGFEAYKQAIDAADVVLLCTPPGFRPAHFEYAVQQGKHVFMEKPVAVDGPGIRKVIEAAKVADQKKLKVVCGLQRRYQNSYLETLKKVKEGVIGDFVSSQVYWVSGGVWVRDRKDGMSEMEYQMRNWYYFNWICGDHIVEQHVHNLDVSNWFKDGQHPVKAVGMGGRTKRVGKNYGQDNNPYDTEHVVLYDHIRSDSPINNAYYTAESTLTAILGRMACYSGAEVTWDQALNSTVDTMPKNLAWDADPGPKAGSDGMYPCPIPGAAGVA